MNKEEVFEIAGKKLVELREIEGYNNILQGKYKLNNSVVAIYYLDYSEEAIALDKLVDFQDKLISTDYYRDSGFLQWNYYLLFIRDVVDLGIKMVVEQNDVYSRKFVLSPNEFETFFRYQKVEGSIKEDIVIKWKERLRVANLHEVISRKATYISAVDRFVNGKPQQEEQLENDSPQATNSVQITNQHIRQLELKDNYRDFPQQRTFDFTSVNLIDGVNGVGKTSLLEAIELVLCGKSNRYSNQPIEQQGSISIAFNGGPIDTFTPRDNSKFQQRDSHWYNNTYQHKNYLDDSFSRYNYFNAEAAYRINSDNPTKYKDLLSAIALGKEFSFIIERLRGFQSRLQTFESDLQKKRAELLKSISDSESQHKEFAGVTSPIGLLNSLYDFLKSIAWKVDSANSIEAAPSVLESSLSLAGTAISELLVASQNLKVMNLAQLKSEESKTDALINRADAINNKLNTSEKSISEASLKLSGLESTLFNLSKLLVYSQTKEALKLIGLKGRVLENIRGAELLNKIADKYESIEWSTLLARHRQFMELKDQTDSSLKKDKETRRELEARLTSLRASLDRLAQIVVDLKDLGRQFLSHNHDAEECPLCSAQYSGAELSRRINEIKSKIDGDEDIKRIQDELSDLSGRIEQMEEQSRQLELVREVARLALQTDFSGLSVDAIQSQLSGAFSSLAATKQRVKDDQELSEALKSQSLTEDDLQDTIAIIMASFPSFNLSRDGESGVNLMIQETLAKIESSRSELTWETENQKTRKKEMAEIGLLYGLDTPKDDIAQFIATRTRWVKSGIQYSIELQKFLSFSHEASFVDINMHLKQAADLFKNFKSATQHQEQLVVLTDIIKRAKGSLTEDVSPKLGRVELGLTVINSILNEEEKDKALSEFFKANDEQIQDIFRRIHAPRELDKVIFTGEEDSEIKIQRVNGKQCGIKEISSGQRSALALSIFLSLNKKLKNGPNLLMFDDPVTFVDDLNILSFLDYLREVVINENRQIFFATANKRLASLFEKKFGFLKVSEHFRYIRLHR